MVIDIFVSVGDSEDALDDEIALLVGDVSLISRIENDCVDAWGEKRLMVGRRFRGQRRNRGSLGLRYRRVVILRHAIKVIFLRTLRNPLRPLRLKFLPQSAQRFTQRTQRKVSGYCRAKVYLLRTNVMDWSAEELWQAYVQLTEAEAAFRIRLVRQLQTRQDGEIGIA